MTQLGSRFEQAVLYATHVHGGHMRKGTTIPYIGHLLAVTALVLEDDGDEDDRSRRSFTMQPKTKAEGSG